MNVGQRYQALKKAGKFSGTLKAALELRAKRELIYTPDGGPKVCFGRITGIAKRNRERRSIKTAVPLGATNVLSRVRAADSARASLRFLRRLWACNPSDRRFDRLRIVPWFFLAKNPKNPLPLGMWMNGSVETFHLAFSSIFPYPKPRRLQCLTTSTDKQNKKIVLLWDCTAQVKTLGSPCL